MSLSAREKRILAEIESDLASAEPLLDSVLGSMRLPTLYGIPLRSLVGHGHRHRTPRKMARNSRPGYVWFLVMLGGVLAGAALLAAGLVISATGMIVGGVVLLQLAPVTVARLAHRRIRGWNNIMRQRA
jgi:hypothetical protein